ncbi:hypothetical protein RRG08_039267 [Elysia crispata]|uniref:PiggyBac transposable element-derived protein domain-containing protein n=1 Tax=Elysia crispata TaxID=231223 RepID=A0AAE1B6M4_9GAST|nr:hypothetical protein RRG08_039267 [Elysia crispata]
MAYENQAHVDKPKHQDCLEGKEGDNINIYLDSPWCQVHADEDIADEDGAVDNQSGNQLQATCTARCGKKTLLEESERRHIFWENAEDSGNQAVHSARTLNRFQEILSALHFADNNLLDTDGKMAKIRPFWAILDECLLQFWPPYNLFTSLPLKEYRVKGKGGAVQLQEERYKDVQLQEELYKDVQLQEELYKDVQLQEEHYKDVQLQEELYKDVQLQEEHYKDVQLQEEHYKDVQLQEEHYKDVQLQEELYKDVQLQEEPYKDVQLQEEHYKDVQLQEEHYKDVQLQEEHYKDVQLQEEHYKDVQLQEEHYKDVQLQEEHYKDVQP